MSKAFTKETEHDDEDLQGETDSVSLPAGLKNYITPAGYRRLLDELNHLVKHERPKVVEAVHWAAKNGDRSENGDYIYGKKRLREIDRRIRFLSKRVESAVQVDPSVHHGKETVYFGASVHYLSDDGQSHRIKILGMDEADNRQGQVSWVSPIAKALIGSQVGDSVVLHTPQGRREIEVVEVDYPLPAA